MSISSAYERLKNKPEFQTSAPIYLDTPETVNTNNTVNPVLQEEEENIAYNEEMKVKLLEQAKRKKIVADQSGVILTLENRIKNLEEALGLVMEQHQKLMMVKEK